MADAKSLDPSRFIASLARDQGIVFLIDDAAQGGMLFVPKALRQHPLLRNAA